MYIIKPISTSQQLPGKGHQQDMMSNSHHTIARVFDTIVNDMGSQHRKEKKSPFKTESPYVRSILS